MKKLLALFLVALMVVPAIALAEDAQISGEVRVTYWGGDSRIEKTTQVAELFMEMYPEVTIILEHGADYWTLLDTQLAAGSAPDVMQFGGNYPDYVNYLLPLNEYLEDGTIDTTYFDQPMIDEATLDGNVYCMCLGANRIGVVYNKSLFETAGATLPDETITWENLGDYLAGVQALLPDGVYATFDASVYEVGYLGYYLGCMGEKLWDGEESTMTAETVASYLQMWSDFRDAGYCPPGDISAEYEESSADTSGLVAGDVGMVFLYANMAVGYQAAMTDTIGVTCLPDRESSQNTMNPSQFFCINKASENADAAAAWINFFVNAPEAGVILGNDRGIPCNSEVRAAVGESLSAVDVEVYNLFDLTADYSTDRYPNPPNDQAVLDAWQTVAYEVAYGTKSVEDAAAEFVEAFNEIIMQ